MAGCEDREMGESSCENGNGEFLVQKEVDHKFEWNVPVRLSSPQDYGVVGRLLRRSISTDKSLKSKTYTVQRRPRMAYLSKFVYFPKQCFELRPAKHNIFSAL
jgi:hypothetical protein